MNNTEAEAAVLGAMFLDPAAADVAQERLCADDFYDPRHAAIFDATLGLETIDLVTVRAALKRKKREKRAGGAAYLATIAETVPTAANVEHYIALVQEKSIRREIYRFAAEASDLAQKEDTDANDVLDTLEHELFKIAERGIRRDAVTTAEIMQDIYTRLEAGGEAQGLHTGFIELDAKIGGLRAGNLVICAGRPSMGKTSLALNIARNIAWAGHPAAFFSVESSKEEIGAKLLCTEARIEPHVLRGGKLGEKVWADIARASERLSRLQLLIDDTPRLRMIELRAKARRMKRRYKIEVLFVDYLQLMTTRAESRLEEVSKISRELKAVAKELQIPVVALSQLNRKAEDRGDKRPMLSDLRESGAIEQDADIVLLLYRDDYYHLEAEEGIAEVNVAKNRMGATGKVKLIFEKQFMAFGNKIYGGE